MEACGWLTIQGGLHLGGVGACAATVELVLAVEAAAAAHLEAAHHAVALLEALHLWAHLIDNAHKLHNKQSACFQEWLGRAQRALEKVPGCHALGRSSLSHVHAVATYIMCS